MVERHLDQTTISEILKASSLRQFGQIANKLVDQNGQKIFRYNRRTHTIELADGRNLDSVQTDEDTKYSFAGKKAKTADKSLLRRASERKTQSHDGAE